MITVIKRDGRHVPFDGQKICEAVGKAAKVAGEFIPISFLKRIVSQLEQNDKQVLTISDIQKHVESCLMKSSFEETARKYIVYRDRRDKDRDREVRRIKTFTEIIEVDDTNLMKENGNVNACIPAGQMMKFASETTKEYALDYLINPKHAKAHIDGDIHIHDLDYYPSRTLTCVQHNLLDLFDGGFCTSESVVREPQSVRSAAALAAIALQSCQNEMHGGQAIPAFDFFMAKYVRRSFVKHYKSAYQLLNKSECPYEDNIISIDSQYLHRDEVYDYALKMTEDKVYQAMEAFVFNMVSMHSRGGGQVVFSSINYGTDTSAEGRMVMKALLDVTERGDANGGTFIFPIQILKVKDGVTFSESDCEKALANIEDALAGKIQFEAPNFDIFLRACVVSARRLFPNFLFLDATFNKNENWKPDDPNRWYWEMASMGCRTRVFENLYGPKTTIGRGNLSFTTINIVRLAIKAKLEAEEELKRLVGNNVDRLELEELAIEKFFKKLDEVLDLTAEQLYDRYQFQRKAKAKQFPFLMGQNVWNGGRTLSPNDNVGDVINSGTLSIGFIGLAECLKMLIGEHHGESERARELGYRIIKHMRAACDTYKAKYKLNYSLLATPAEGLSGRFTEKDRKLFGVIPGVTDREYYTNSNHVPVYCPITAYEKIRIEAPYHELTNAGHILYVEMDGDAKNNILAYIKIVREMYRNNVGYGAVNHPVDRCLKCGFDGVIKDACPACGEQELIDRIARITGYLVGTLDRWNGYKLAEFRDRVKHV